jgi:hypothetical protein
MPDNSCPAGEMTKKIYQKVVVHVTDIGGVCEMTLKVLVRSLDLNLLLIWVSKFCSQLIYFQNYSNAKAKSFFGLPWPKRKRYEVRSKLLC